MTNHSGIIDNGEVFQIIPTTRQIVAPHGYSVIGAMGDHNSEELTFACPKQVDGHDVMNCASHYVQWQNAAGETGRVEMTDITTDDDNVYMKWLVGSDVTATPGTLSFAVCFEDRTDDSTLLYRWGTVTCDALQVLSTAVGDVIHRIYDSDNHFTINPVSREIKNVLSSNVAITQFDHNSDRFTFEIPRNIDGHDMSLCNRVEIHFINLSTNGLAQNAGVYVVEDLQTDQNDNDVVIFSWLIPQEATQHAGIVQFMVRFAKLNMDEQYVEYSWNTAIKDVTVGSGINNHKQVVKLYSDILTKWEQEAREKIINDLSVFTDIRMITKAEFEALETKENNVLYVFTDDDTLEEIDKRITAVEENTPASETSIAELTTKVDNIVNGTTVIAKASNAGYANSAGSANNTKKVNNLEVKEDASDGNIIIQDKGILSYKKLMFLYSSGQKISGSQAISISLTAFEGVNKLEIWYGLSEYASVKRRLAVTIPSNGETGRLYGIDEVHPLGDDAANFYIKNYVLKLRNDGTSLYFSLGDSSQVTFNNSSVSTKSVAGDYFFIYEIYGIIE